MNTLEGNKLIADYELFKVRGYSIDSLGNILGKTGNPLKLHRGTSGYLQVNTFENSKQKTFLVHRLIAQNYLTQGK